MLRKIIKYKNIESGLHVIACGLLMSLLALPTAITEAAGITPAKAPQTAATAAAASKPEPTAVTTAPKTEKIAPAKKPVSTYKVPTAPVAHQKPTAANGSIAVTTGNVTGVNSSSGPLSTQASITMSQQVKTGKDAMEKDDSNDLYFVTWSKILDAVRYEVEFFQGNNHDIPVDRLSWESVYFDQWVFTPGIQLTKKDLTGNGDIDNVYYRVRALNIDGKPISPFSHLKRLDPYYAKRPYWSPYPLTHVFKQQGDAVLYPVYSYIGIPGQYKYEIEVTDEYPENIDDYKPSIHRVWSATTQYNDQYDDAPRIGQTFWRVRAMDANGNPVGKWSKPVENHLDPNQKWDVAVFGDSISHGGGRMSFSPSDLEYSYEHYLSFPAVNLSKSGDTSKTMLERFDRDVLPFHPHYLLIMGGTNSLRGGTRATQVISELKAIQEKCRRNGILPILMTLAPINPANIKRCFDEATAPDWKVQFDTVNEFILKQEPHIDAAKSVRMLNILPTNLAVDGLHGDWRLKNMMAKEINSSMREIMKADKAAAAAKSK